MKILNNIIIICLIGLLSSTYLFNLSPIDYRGSIKIDTPEETSTLNLELGKYDAINPNLIVINHTAQKNEVLKSISDSIFTANIYQNDKLVLSNIKNLELMAPSSNMSISIKKDNPMITTLDISQKKLGLDDGTYKIVFQSNLISETDKSTISVEVTYDTGGTYYPAVNSTSPGTKGLTLYFVSKNNILIPVTRFVVEDKSLTRMAIEQLQNGPVDSEMKTFIKDVNNTTYNNGNVVIDLPSSYEGYNKDIDESKLIYQSFVKTIFAVDRYWPIYSLSFTVDRKKVDTYFNDIDTKSAVSNNKKHYCIYLADKTDNRYYLFDKQIDTEKAGINSQNTISINAQNFYNAYLNSEYATGRKPMPDNLKLNGITQNGSSLILDFDKNLLNIYDKKEDLRNMLIDSLIYSFTTIPNVDSIMMTVNNEPLKNFIKNRDLSGILYPPEFINPELVQ